MKLLVINGSPKLGENNTGILLEKFIEGFLEEDGNSVETFRMNRKETYLLGAEKFNEAQNILIAFPLYSYSMPAGVKLFIEGLEPYLKKCSEKRVGFLVQYGFMEATHARPLEKYLKSLCVMLDCEYLGTIIRGGCDGLTKGKTPSKKILPEIYEIGKTLGIHGTFDSEQLLQYSAPEVQKKISPFIAKVIFWLINKLYWQRAMKKNGVSLKDSFAKPHGK